VKKVPVTRKTLESLYELSPKMMELKPHLAASADKLMFNGELPAAIFIFTFRDAVAAAGYFGQNARETLRFFKELGDDLEGLCNEGSLECGSVILSMVPLWRGEYTRRLPEAFFNQFYLMVMFPEFNVMPYGNYSFADLRFLYETGRLSHSMPRVTKHQQWDTRLPAGVKEFKLEIARTLGNGHQIIRPALFLCALAAWIYFALIDIRSKKLSFLNCYVATLIVGLSTLAAALAIIEITSFHMLFRPRHNGYPLVSLLIVCVLVEWRHRGKRGGELEPETAAAR
jgi:hypothetical protein